MADTTDDLIALREGERRQLLDATLIEVPFEGWSRRAMTLGARALGWPEADVDRLFPSGAIEMIEFWNAEADRAVETAFADVAPGSMRMRQRIAFGVRSRLDFVEGHAEAVRRALAVLALPQHAATGPTLLWRTADAIWWAAGDTATDWNFYSKRALLSAVYGSTLLFWLDDRSPDRGATWAFLDRRIENVMALPRVMSDLRDRVRRATLPLAGLRMPRGMSGRGE